MKKSESFHFVRSQHNQFWEAKEYYRNKNILLEKLKEHIKYIKSPIIKYLGIKVFNKRYKKSIREEIKRTENLIKRSKISIRFIKSKLKRLNIALG